MKFFGVFDTGMPDNIRAGDKVVTAVTVDPVIQEFSYDEIVKGRRKIKCVTNDIQVFFNQQRLMKLGQGALDRVLEIARTRPMLNRNKMSDKQLLGLVKSRYLQSPADLYNYALANQTQLEEFVDALVKDHEAAEAAAASAASGSGSADTPE